MFKTFTEKAIKVVMVAHQESINLGYDFVGTEQILLGLLWDGSLAARTLGSMGVNLNDTRAQVERTIGRGSGCVSIEMKFTARAKLAFKLAQEEARRLGHNYIDTEHLLFGLVAEGTGVAVQVLQELGINLIELEERVRKVIVEQNKAIEPNSGTLEA